MLRRALLLLALSPLLAPVSAPAAQLAITRADGTTATAPVDAQAGTERRVQAPEGPRAVTGVGLGSALRAADVQPFDLRALTVSAPGGASLALDRASAFADDGPVLFEDAGGLHLVGGGRELVAPDGTLAVALSDSDSSVTVTASARPARVEPGDQVTFVAASPASGVTFSWQLGDGSSSGGRRVTHRFTKPGSYTAVVGATTPGDPTGASAIVVVQVGRPRAAATPTATPSPGATPAAGGTGAGGGRGSETGAGSATGAGSGSSPGAAAGPAPSRATTPTPTPAKRSATPSPSPEPTASATAQPAGETVAGELLDRGSVVAAAVAQPPSGGGDDDSENGGLSIPPGAWALGGALLAGLAGFRLDMRRSRPRWWTA